MRGFSLRLWQPLAIVFHTRFNLASQANYTIAALRGPVMAARQKTDNILFGN